MSGLASEIVRSSVGKSRWMVADRNCAFPSKRINICIELNISAISARFIPIKNAHTPLAAVGRNVFIFASFSSFHVVPDPWLVHLRKPRSVTAAPSPRCQFDWTECQPLVNGRQRDVIFWRNVWLPSVKWAITCALATILWWNSNQLNHRSKHKITCSVVQ